MKMYLKRIIPILLSALLCLNMSFAAFAEGEVADSVPAPELGSAETVYGSGWINVSETGSVTVGSYGSEVAPIASPVYGDPVTTPEDAAAFIKKCMESRIPAFSFTFLNVCNLSVVGVNEVPDYMAGLEKIIFDLVYEHDISDPEGGDYLDNCLTAGDFLPPDEHSMSWDYNISYTSLSTWVDATLMFSANYYTTREQEDELNRKIDEVITSLELDGKTNYEKVKAVHDWIAKNVIYDRAHLEDNSYPLKQTAYAAMINGTSVCQGYATLFYKMMLKLGIDCRIITGRSHNESHAWNIVKICDRYYYIDCTWDSNYLEQGGPIDTFFLKSAATFGSDHFTDSESSAKLGAYIISDTDFDTANPDAVHNYGPDGRCINCGEMKESSGDTVLKGDVNGNGEVELGDAVLILRYLAKLDVGETFVEKAAYFNDDEVIDLSDAVDILRMLAKIS